MSNKGGNTVPRITEAEHIGPDDTGDNINAKRSAIYGYDTDASEWRRAKVNADGKLETTATFSGSVNAVTEYEDGETTPATPQGPTIAFDDSGTMRTVSDTNPLPVDATVNATVDLGDQNIGNATDSTQRVVLASNQPVIPISDNGGSLTVDGTFWQATQPVSAASLPLPTGAATAANQSTIIGHIDGVETLLGTIDSDTSTLAGAVSGSEMQVDIVSSAAIPVTDNGSSLTVDGSVAATQSGTWSTRTQDGSGNAISSTSNALDINLKTSDVSIGGGTEYDDGDAVATPAGKVALGYDGTNVQALATDSSGNLQVDVLNTSIPVTDAGGSLTVDGTVTANLGAVDNAVLDSIDSAVNGTLTVDGSGVTQPVSDAGGSLTVDNAGLTELAAAINTNRVDINIANDSVGIGGGTQYADGAADATPTGTVAMGTDGTNVFALATDTSGQLQTEVTNTVTVDGSGVTQPVSASALPLPTGAATAANQSTANGILTTIDTDTGSIATSASTIAGAVAGSEMQVDIVSSAAIPVTDNGSSLTVDGTVAATQSGSWSLAANQSVNVAQMNGVSTTMGNGASGTGVQRVTIASDSTGVITARGAAAVDAAVSGNPVYTGGRASTATPSAVSADGDAQALWLTRNGALNIADGGGSLTVDGTVAVSGTVIVDGSSSTQPVSGTVTANLSATDNAVLDSIETNSLHRGATSAVTSVSGSASSVQLLAANADRQEVVITNDSTADLYVKLGTTASTSSYTVKLGQDESYIDNTYTGRIDGIWGSATGNARITEID